jgi:hypothetical protein
MDKAKIQHYGDELYQALLGRKAVDPLTDREPSITIEDQQDRDADARSQPTRFWADDLGHGFQRRRGDPR